MCPNSVRLCRKTFSGAPVMATGSQAAADRADQDGEFYDAADSEIVLTIKELLETRVRPAVAQDAAHSCTHSRPRSPTLMDTPDFRTSFPCTS